MSHRTKKSNCAFRIFSGANFGNRADIIKATFLSGIKPCWSGLKEVKSTVDFIRLFDKI
jgi:hypothetical protein